MSYDPISPLSRRGEKIAPFVTTQNVIGMVALAAPAYVLAAPLPPMMRVGLTILMVVVAYILTNEARGMAPYERVLWRIRGWVRTQVRGRTISPAMLPDTIARARVPVSRQGGAVRLTIGIPKELRVAIAASARPSRRPRSVARPVAALTNELEAVNANP